MAFDRSQGSGSMSQINVTPLVDVMLVLLVIFMVTAPILQQGVAVDLPIAELGPLDGAPAPFVVSLTATGAVYLNDDELPRDSVIASLRERIGESEGETVYVRADESLPYGEVMSVMAAIREAGIRNVGMVTQPAFDAG